jgi:membrane-bound lytic murein transglycosylase D
MTAAQAAERAGMSEADLRSVNNIPPRMLVRAGSSLLVHRSAHRDADVPEHVADNGQLSLQPEIILKRSTVRARKGDNLARLASRYGVSPVSAAGWNKLAVNARLKRGQQITLMLPQRVSLAQADPVRRTSKARETNEARQSTRKGKATPVARGKTARVEAVADNTGGKKGKKATATQQAKAQSGSKLVKAQSGKKARADTKVALNNKATKKR